MLDSQELEEEAILAALMGISEMLADIGDLDELLDAIVRIAPRLAAVSRCSIVLRSPRTKELRVAHSFSRDPQSTAVLQRLVLREADIPELATKLFEQRIPVMIREGRVNLLPAPVTQTFRIRSMLLVPLAYQEQVLGFMAIDEPGRDHVFTSREVNVVNAVASHAATALVHARLRESLHREWRRGEAVASSISDGLVTVDANLRIVALSSGAESLLGWTTEEVMGRPVGDVLEREGAGAGSLAEVLRQSFAGGERGAAALQLRRKDGATVECLVTLAPVRSTSGTVLEVVCILSKVERGPRRPTA